MQNQGNTGYQGNRFSGRQGNFNQGSSRSSGQYQQNYQDGPSSFSGGNYQTPLDPLIEATEQKLNSLYQARDGYINAEQIEQSFGWSGGGTGGFTSGRSSSSRGSGDNQGNFGGNQGGPRFSEGSDDQADGRTMAGRQQHDAEGMNPQELIGFLSSAPRNEDNSIDLRTTEGRALKAAGWVDEDGFEMENVTSQYSRSGGRGSHRSGYQSNSRSGSK